MTTLVQATEEQLTAELLSRQNATTLAAREATRDEVQDFIDDNSKLNAAGIVAVTDTQDTMWVGLTFPADADGSPAFWTSVARNIMSQDGKSHAGASLRVNKNKAITHLTAIAVLLP